MELNLAMKKLMQKLKESIGIILVLAILVGVGVISYHSFDQSRKAMTVTSVQQSTETKPATTDKVDDGKGKAGTFRLTGIKATFAP